MPFDAMAMAAISDEISQAAGGRVQGVIQPSSASIALSLYAGGQLRSLVASADSQRARVAFASDRLAKAFLTPSPFVMLLRKHLEGGRLSGVRHIPYERILELHFSRSGEELTLLIEAMGKYSNLILVDREQRILGALKIVTQKQSRVRLIAPSLTYQSPPSRGIDRELYEQGERVDPWVDPVGFETQLNSIEKDTTAERALLGLLPGAGPFLARQIVLSAGQAESQPLSTLDKRGLLEAARSKYALYESRAWTPTVFVNERGRPDFSPFAPVGVTEVSGVETMSQAVEANLGAEESRDALAALKRGLLTTVERSQRSAAGRILSLQSGLEATESAAKAMHEGQLILTYQHAIIPGATRLEIDELGESIPLNPRLSAAENAQRAFRRYRKLRDARKQIPLLLAAAQVEADRLHDLASFVQLADSQEVLHNLKLEMGRQKGDSKKRAPKRKIAKGLRFRRGDYSALAGRNAAENEEVTFKLSNRNDLWLHARGRTGAHVVLRSETAQLTDEAIEAAAQLAAYFSEGRRDTAVDVVVTPVRNVHKIRGAAPGRVTYSEERTLRVTPSEDAWERV